MNWIKIIRAHESEFEGAVNAFFEQCARDNLHVVNTKYHYDERTGMARAFIQYRQR